MSPFCVNRNENERGYHSVHRLDSFVHEDGSFGPCPTLPNPENQVLLGVQAHVDFAVMLAQTMVSKYSDPCGNCCD